MTEEEEASRDAQPLNGNVKASPSGRKRWLKRLGAWISTRPAWQSASKALGIFAWQEWLALSSVILGLSLMFIVATDTTGIVQRSGLYWIGGAALLLSGLIILWLQKRPWWPEVLLVLFVAGIVFNLFRPRLDQLDTLVRLPLPSSRIMGGASALYPGQMIEVMAMIPNTSGTPVARSFPDVEVQTRQQQGTDETVILAVPLSSVRELQSALLDEKVRFTYRLLSGTTTPLTPTPTMNPTATPTLVGLLELQIRASDIYPDARSVTIGKPIRLMVVERSGSNPSTADSATMRVSFQGCVKVMSFLDKNGTQRDSYDEAITDRLLIRLPADQVVAAARGLTGAERVWLIDDPQCTVVLAP
jgi:hypothetical protein